MISRTREKNLATGPNHLQRSGEPIPAGFCPPVADLPGRHQQPL